MFRKVITILTISFLFSLPVQAVSPTLVSDQTTTNAQISASSASWTFAHDSGTAGSNRGLIVWPGVSGGDSLVSGITYNGSAMTKLVAFTATQWLSTTVWFLADPSTGSNNVVISYTEVRVGKAASAFTLQDVVQSSPLDVTEIAGVGSGTSVTKEITTTEDSDIVINQLINHPTTSGNTPDAGQTSLGETTESLNTNWSFIEKATAGAITTGYDWTTSSAADFYVLSLKFVAPPPPVEVIQRRKATNQESIH